MSLGKGFALILFAQHPGAYWVCYCFDFSFVVVPLPRSAAQLPQYVQSALCSIVAVVLPHNAFTCTRFIIDHGKLRDRHGHISDMLECRQRHKSDDVIEFLDISEWYFSSRKQYIRTWFTCLL